jgi:molybdopterin synthase catalytic subunit
MDVEGIMDRIRKHPDSHQIGMIASHLGIVRASSRDGRKVARIEVAYDMNSLNNIIKYIKSLPGIIEVLAEVNEGLLNVGDEILFVAVGGDIRDNVFPALFKAVNLIKKEASRKKEIFG